MSLPAIRRFKFYVNLATTEQKLRKLLNDFEWAPAAEVLGLESAAA